MKDDQSKLVYEIYGKHELVILDRNTNIPFVADLICLDPLHVKEMIFGDFISKRSSQGYT